MSTAVSELPTAAERPPAGAAAGLRAVLAPVRGRLALAAGLQVVGALAGLAPYFAVVGIARELLSEEPDDGAEVWRWVVVAGIGFLVRTSCAAAAYTISHIADADVGVGLRRAMADRLGRVPLGWFTERSSGRVKRALTDDVAAVHHLVAHAVNDLVAAVLTPVVALVYLFVLDWRLALVCLAPLIVWFGLTALMSRDEEARMVRWNAELEKVDAAVIEYVDGIAVVKAFGQAGRAQDRYRRAGDDLARFLGEWLGPMHRLEAISSVLISPPVLLVVALCGGVWLGTDPVELIAFTMLVVGLGAPVLALGFGTLALQVARAAADRVAEVLATPELTRACEPTVPGGAHVEFDRVRFSYDGRGYAVDGIDLTLAPGSVTALVGASGSGKSTLARLLPRFWDVEEGSVRIGGVDVRDIAEDDLYRLIGFVFQETSLLRTSIRDNIALGRPDADQATIEAAARAAAVHDRITALPRGYASVVGEDAQLSGGEAQRIAIARAIVADAPILVLDEATAFADPESEAAVQDALSHVIAGRTLVVIAHRLHTIRGADRIVVLSRGRVVEAGHHDELLAAGGEYARMWAAQSLPKERTR
ncbi:ABC transporter ATP-binding protein [Nocardia cyriacigeorgica]|uniref:ABC transporter ATP-binding protein n=1 Tax=Nocardia cyriacigeorgica TaxID=135487 RepID=A0ABX0CSE4_9NOCA|nr:ABC transporter ATP-binding protein [Nocardia cyriacigeorgica]NEW49161.1 ABC transporter ATP-binding protein [Nocardia cyriacigeorgica]NEW59323.1 ABC transporter ATP-binding protein [Nocardia cyriacigeorgica]